MAIGNLSTGGTGKTPMTEWMIRKLGLPYNMAVLSRGYGRKTKEFIVVNEDMEATVCGDEPLQIKNNFRDNMVVVCRKRKEGLQKIETDFPKTQIVILDDALQHRKVKATCNILLTTYDDPFFSDFVLPAGNLREWRCGFKRADIIIVSKSPNVLTETQRQFVHQKIKKQRHQIVVFSSEKFADPFCRCGTNKRIEHALLVCGIANPSTLKKQLTNLGIVFTSKFYRDHYAFSVVDVHAMVTAASTHKTIITTDKDWMRLKKFKSVFDQEKISVFTISIETIFSLADENALMQKLETYLSPQ